VAALAARRPLLPGAIAAIPAARTF